MRTITAKQIRAIREGWRMTQDEFASMLGASVRTYQEWEQGRAKVPTHVARHVATIGSLKLIYVHWDRIAQAIVCTGGTALTGESLVAALNEADALSDDHEQLWADLFPALKRDKDDQ